jgi:hypothetical protein
MNERMESGSIRDLTHVPFSFSLGFESNRVVK